MVKQSKWYAVHVRSNQEQTTAKYLENNDIELFLPGYMAQSTRVDRKLFLNKPLFPGYLFVAIDIASIQRLHILKAPGVIKIVSFSDKPISIPAAVIESLKIVVGSKEDQYQVRPHPLIKAGQKVIVIDGPFRGACGVLHQLDKRKHCLVIDVEFLGRGVSVPVFSSQVKPVFN